MTRMAIVTLAGDLHAYVIRQRMQEHHGIDVAIVAVDRLAAAGGISWHNEGDHAVTLASQHVRDPHGRCTSVSLTSGPPSAPDADVGVFRR